MQIKQIAQVIEEVAPLMYQESYDNCGLQVGDPDSEVSGALLTLDVTEEVIAEAIERGCNLIIAHHPLIFSGLKRITGKNYVERCVRMAIKHDISIYAAHTNLDNMYRGGVNALIGTKLGLTDTQILQPKENTLAKLCTYAPREIAAQVLDALFAAGAGSIGKYDQCSFSSIGTGTFRPGLDTNPTIGTAGGQRELVDEVRIEVIVPQHLRTSVLKALFSAHTYEEVAYELIAIPNQNPEIGAGMVGNLPQPLSEFEFLAFLKANMKAEVVRHTALLGKPISRVAVCGGSGSFLLKDAISAGAQVFVTADFKYHQFFDAEGKIMIADIGHFETEQFTPEIFESVLRKKFPNFAVLLSNVLTNPVKYFC